MKEITIVEPQFVTTFKCVGSECPDHCCKGWKIKLDKPTVNHYLKSSPIEIRNIASEHIITTKNSFNDWGEMKLTSKGICAFMDEDRLCKVHKMMGASALSNTCSTYPRRNNVYKNEEYHTIVLSCPEATRQLLTQPDAMLFKHSVQLKPQMNKAADIAQEQKLVNLMCANIVKSSGENMATGLYGIAVLFLHMDKLNRKEAFFVAKLENAYFNVISSLEDGSIFKQISVVNSNYELQWALLMRMQTYFSTRISIRSSNVFQHYSAKLLHIQAEGAKIDDVSSSMKLLNAVWQEKVAPWLSERPWLMSNYLQYRIYNDNFPDYDGHSPISSLYLLTAEWFLIKSMISACVALVGDVLENDIINIIYSFHALTKHDENATKAFFEEIDKVKVNDDLSLIYLLK